MGATDSNSGPHCTQQVLLATELLPSLFSAFLANTPQLKEITVLSSCSAPARLHLPMPPTDVGTPSPGPGSAGHAPAAAAAREPMSLGSRCLFPLGKAPFLGLCLLYLLPELTKCPFELKSIDLNSGGYNLKKKKKGRRNAQEG